MTVKVVDAGGKAVTGAVVRAEVKMTSMDMGTARPPFREMGSGLYAGDVTLSMAGPWRITLSVTPPGSKTPIVKILDVRAVESDRQGQGG